MSDLSFVSLAPPAVHHVLGGGQPDDEEVQDDEEPGRLLWRLGEEGWRAEQWGVPGEKNWCLYQQREQSDSAEQLLVVFIR